MPGFPSLVIAVLVFTGRRRSPYRSIPRATDFALRLATIGFDTRRDTQTKEIRAMTNHKTGTRKAKRTTETRKRKATTGTRTTKRKTGTRKEWLAKRLELLKAEKEHTRRGDELARRRQALPWVRIDK
jgi:hypothetical protein